MILFYDKNDVPFFTDIYIYNMSEFYTIHKGKMTHIIIFVDWDNTLLPTNLLTNDSHYFKYGVISDDMLKQLAQLEKSVETLLDSILAQANLFIVTNAELNWVNLSAQTYFPKLYKKLGNYKIISARDLHCDKFPKNIAKWKYEVFKQIIDKIKKDSNMKVHVVNIADGDLEYDAIKLLFKLHQNFYIKNVQIIEQSSISKLKKQLDLINTNLDTIVKHNGDLTVKLKIIK